MDALHPGEYGYGFTVALPTFSFYNAEGERDITRIFCSKPFDLISMVSSPVIRKHSNVYSEPTHYFNVLPSRSRIALQYIQYIFVINRKCSKLLNCSYRFCFLHIYPYWDYSASNWGRSGVLCANIVRRRWKFGVHIYVGTTKGAVNPDSLVIFDIFSKI